MVNNADIHSPTGGYSETGPQTPEARRRSSVVGGATFMVEQAMGSMYPHIPLPAEFAINGYPDNAAEVARTSTAAAHQAIQGAINSQVPEAQ